MKKRTVNTKNLLILAMVLVLIGVTVSCSVKKLGENQTRYKYLGNYSSTVNVFTNEYGSGELVTFNRGTKVEVLDSFQIKDENDQTQSISTIKIENDNLQYYVDSNILVDKFEQSVFEKEVYVQYFTNLVDDNSKILALLEEGTKLEVISHNLDESGKVTRYKVNYDGVEGYVNSHYLVVDESEVNNRYVLESKDEDGRTVSDRLDRVNEKYNNFNFKPRKKPNYESNPYRDDIKGVYISLHTLLSQDFDLDEYINVLTVNSPLNAFVFDIKHDQGELLFQSDTAEAFGTTASHRALTKEKLSEMIKKLKENDIYLIGRIVTFRDNYFAEKYPESAITLKSNGKFYEYDNSIFISAHSRKIWEYNVGIAKEAAELGFNEIQYDYVRFSENLNTSKHNVPKPISSETKTQAVQRFLEYAKDQLESYEVYLAADIYGLASYLDRDSVRIGQFFEAISTTVDVISPMAYPSHYDAYHSISDSSVKIGWPNTYKEYEMLIKYYTMDLLNRNNRLPEPANLRIWIEGYSSAIGTNEKMPAQVAGLKYNKVDSYLYWGNGWGYNIDAIKKAEQ